MMTNYQKLKACSIEAAKAQEDGGIAEHVVALRRKRHELDKTDVTYREKELGKQRHQLNVLKRSLLEPTRLLEQAYAREKELVSNPSAGRVKHLEHCAKQRKEDFPSVVEKKYEEYLKAVRSGLNQICDELKETPAHDVDSLSKWFNQKFQEFSMEDVKDIITLVNFDELKTISVSLPSCSLRCNYYNKVIGKFANKDAIQKVAQLEMKKEDDAERAEIRKEEQENGEAIEAWRHAYYCVLEDAVNTVNKIENAILLKKKEVREKGEEYHHVSQKVNRDSIIIALYDREFSKNPELLKKPMTEVAKIWKKPTKMVVEQKPVCTHLCSVEGLVSAMIWLSTGLGGMFREIDPIVFLALLTSTFTSSVCETGASTKLFEFIVSKLKTGGITGRNADSKARVHHDNTGCLGCMNCANTCTLLKFGPNGKNSIMYHDESTTALSDAHLHCKLSDRAMKSITVGVASLNEYGLFSILLYICQLIKYLYPGNTKMIGVAIDDNKVHDVKYLQSTLFQKYLPTHPILAVLVKKYQIPVDISNPIDPTDIANALRAFLNITEEEGHDRLSQIYREYESKAEERLQRTNRRFTQSCDWENSFCRNYGHDSKAPCPYPDCSCRW